MLVVVDQFLKRHGFLNKKEEGLQVVEHSPLRRGLRTAHEGSPARSQLRQGLQSHYESGSVRDRSSSGRQHTRIEDEYPRSPSQMPPPQLIPHKRLALSNSEDTSRRKVTPSRREVFEGSGLAGDEESRGRLIVESSGKRHRWIEDIVAVGLFGLGITHFNIVGRPYRSYVILALRLPHSHHLQGPAPPRSQRFDSPSGPPSRLQSYIISL